MTGNLIISADGDNDRVLDYTDLIENRRFVIPLGTIYYVFRREPVVVDTDHGFLVKAKNKLVCQLGSTYDQREIIIHKDIRMNSNHITNLRELTYPHEVANKLYVDTRPCKILHSYVSDLRTNSGEPNNKFGFVVTASSYHSNMLQPTNAL